MNYSTSPHSPALSDMNMLYLPNALFILNTFFYYLDVCIVLNSVSLIHNYVAIYVLVAILFSF